MSISTKDLIMEYLIEKTELYGTDNLQYFTTNQISYQFSISRSLTSQYLNELCKEEQLIKVSSRPVYYFYRKSLEKRFMVSLEQNEYFNMSDLMNVVAKSKRREDIFSDVIGYEGSLYPCISQLKSAMMYPPNGLPIILQGDKYIEKRFLVEKLFRYCQSKNLLQKHAKLICKEVIGEEQDQLYDCLFSTKTNLFQECNGGLLYLYNATALHRKTQRKLADYIKENVSKESTRIILGMETSEYEQLEESLQTAIPLVCQLPTWQQRSRQEREELVLHFFRKEEQRLQKPIRITETLFMALIEHDFLANIDELKNTIRAICVNAWLEHEKDEVLDVTTQHLPNFLPIDMEKNKWRITTNDSFLINERNHDSETSKKLLSFFDQLIDCHISYQETHASFADFCEQGLQLLRGYYDFIVFESRYEDERLRTAEEKMSQVLKTIEKQYQIKLPLNCYFVLTRIVCHMSSKYTVAGVWEQQRKNDISDCMKTLMSQLPAETMMAMQMRKCLSSTMDIQLSDGNMVFLILNIHFYNRDIASQEICGLIVSHGYSTATSIADACNQLLQANVFKALDMPLDTQVEQIIHQIEDFIQLYPFYKQLILMVDMGSLVELGHKLNANITIGVINNISTGVALDIGSSILQHRELKQILESACEHARYEYQIINRQSKEKAIVFTNDAGIKVSQRMVKLFQDSLMKPIDLQFIAYDYDVLSSNMEQDALFETYDVQLMVKPYTLQLDIVPSLSLEEIVGFQQIERLHSVLAQYLSQAEIEQFNQQLLKNFSLQSVMENLTILNPSRLLDNISDAVQQLQHLMLRKFHSKTIAGIYIHISFLMERLVTKNAIETHKDLGQFVEQQKQFINDVNASFEGMLTHYNVALPISEVAYLYDYILHDEEELGGKK